MFSNTIIKRVTEKGKTGERAEAFHLLVHCPDGHNWARPGQRQELFPGIPHGVGASTRAVLAASQHVVSESASGAFKTQTDADTALPALPGC